MNLAKRSFACFAAVLALSACRAFDKEEPPMCPRVSALADSVTMTRFKPGPGRDLTDVELKAEMTSYHGTCRYNPESRQMTLALQVGIDAERRPALSGRRADIAYYIAIPAFYPDPKAKQVFPVTLEFPSDANRTHVTDGEVEIAMPIANLKELPKYEVFIGLQLTPDEVAFNRRQKAPR